MDSGSSQHVPIANFHPVSTTNFGCELSMICTKLDKMEGLGVNSGGRGANLGGLGINWTVLGPTRAGKTLGADLRKTISGLAKTTPGWGLVWTSNIGPGWAVNP